MSFIIAGQYLIRYNDHYKYNTRATPGRSQLVIYIIIINNKKNYNIFKIVYIQVTQISIYKYELEK